MPPALLFRDMCLLECQIIKSNVTALIRMLEGTKDGHIDEVIERAAWIEESATHLNNLVKKGAQ